MMKTAIKPNGLKTEKEITEYDMRVKAMTLATQHSRNCHSGTLIKLADTIYDFLTGKPYKGKYINAE